MVHCKVTQSNYVLSGGRAVWQKEHQWLNFAAIFRHQRDKLVVTSTHLRVCMHSLMLGKLYSITVSNREGVNSILVILLSLMNWQSCGGSYITLSGIIYKLTPKRATENMENLILLYRWVIPSVYYDIRISRNTIWIISFQRVRFCRPILADRYYTALNSKN